MTELYEPGIDLVVVNYQTAGDLANFLQSLLDSGTDLPFHCSVMNVEAQELDKDVSETWRATFPNDLTVVNFNENVGYARSCNAGAAHGNREVVALFNADVRLTDSALDSCHEALMAPDGPGILGPRQIDDQGRLVHAGIFGTLDQPLHRGWHEASRGDNYTDVRPAVTVAGSAYFIRRSVWDELTECSLYRDVAPAAQGAFLPTPHYYEETFCSYHAQAHGHRVDYFGSVTIHHKWHAASPHGGYAERQFPTSRAIFRAACDHHQIPHD